MTDEQNPIWERVAYFVGNVIIPLLTIWTLWLARETLNVAKDTLKDGAALKEQIIQIHQLVQLQEGQIITNKALVASLDSLHLEIVQARKSTDIAFEQFKVAKKSLDLVLRDKAYSAKLDSQALMLSTRRLKRAFLEDMRPFAEHPLDTSRNVGHIFEEKLNFLELQVASIGANRSLMARGYEYRNLMSLLAFIEYARSTITSFGHNYREVDSSIVHNFLRINAGLQYVEKNEPASDKSFQHSFDETESYMYTEAVKLYNELSNPKRHKG